MWVTWDHHQCILLQRHQWIVLQCLECCSLYIPTHTQTHSINAYNQHTNTHTHACITHHSPLKFNVVSDVSDLRPSPMDCAPTSPMLLPVHPNTHKRIQLMHTINTHKHTHTQTYTRIHHHITHNTGFERWVMYACVCVCVFTVCVNCMRLCVCWDVQTTRLETLEHNQLVMVSSHSHHLQHWIWVVSDLVVYADVCVDCMR